MVGNLLLRGMLVGVFAGVTAGLPVPAFAADLAAGTGPASSVSLPAFTWTRLYLGANAGAWFAPANPSYEAIGFPSAGFDLVPNGDGESAGFTGGFQAGYNYQIGSRVLGFETYFLRQTIGLGGGTEQIEAGANQLAGPVA